MNQYTAFAHVYDTFMDNIPYDEWCGYLTVLLSEHGISGGIIGELGCGTGALSMRLATCGYKVAGVDISSDMLNAAAEKLTPFYRRRILYTLQDMREFIFKKPVKAIVSLCDSMNYMLTAEDFMSVLKSVKNNLKNGGIFIFDLKTEYFYETVLGDTCLADNYRTGSFIWDNHYYPDKHINEYDLTIFVRKKKNIYKKYTELHRQRAYSVEEVKAMINASGLKLLNIYNAFTHDPAALESQRIYFILRKEV